MFGQKKRSPSSLGMSFAPTNMTKEKKDRVSEKRRVPKKFFDIVISTSLLALFFGTPLFFLNVTFQGVLFEKQMYFYFWLLIGLIAWTVQGVTGGALRIRRTPFDIFILALWGASLFSFFFSPDIWRSFVGGFIDPSRGFLATTAFTLFYFFVLSVINEKRAKLMFSSLLWSGIVTIIISFFSLLNIGILPGWFPVSVMGSITALGIFFALLIPLFITGVFLPPVEKSLLGKKVMNGILLGALLLDLLVMLIIYNYVPWIALLIGLGSFLLFILSQFIRPNENFVWVPMVAFVGVLVILMVGSNEFSRVSLPNEIYPSTALSWDVAKNTMKEEIFFGAGPGMYEHAFSLYAPDSFLQSRFADFRFQYGRGMFFEIFTTGGMLGVIAFGAFAVAIVVIGTYLLTREKQKNKVFSLGVVASFVIIALASLMTLVHGSALILLIFLGTLCVGVLLMESEKEAVFWDLSVQASPRFALAMSFISLLLMVGVALVFVLMGRALVADIYAERGNIQEKISEEGSISYFARAAQLYPKEGHYLLRIGQEYLALANEEALKGDDRDEEKIAYYLEQSRRAVSLGRNNLPASALAQENVATIYDGIAFYLPQAVGQAQDEYKKILNLEPRNSRIYVKLGQLELAKARALEGEEEKENALAVALEYFSSALEIRPVYPLASYQRALTYDALENKEEAIKNLEEAVRNAGKPGNIRYTFVLARAYQERNGEGDVDRAEALFRSILGVNDTEINTLLNLGLLYERSGDRTQAIESYERVLSALPEEAVEARNQLEGFIRNLQEGRDNISPTTSPGMNLQQEQALEEEQIQPQEQEAQGVTPSEELEQAQEEIIGESLPIEGENTLPAPQGQ